jgi:hypothetical protein
MATVYALPKELPWAEPDYKNYDYRAEQAREDEYTKKLQEWCKARNKGNTVGEIIMWGVADGYAQYMVVNEKPLQLFHLPFGDAYSAGAVWERGLRITDVRRMVANKRNPLFR